MKAMVQAQGDDPTNVGAHSMRQGKGVERFHNQASIASVVHTLRHTSPHSCEPCVLGAAKLAAVARTQREIEQRGRTPSGIDPSEAELRPLPLNENGEETAHPYEQVPWGPEEGPTLRVARSVPEARADFLEQAPQRARKGRPFRPSRHLSVLADQEVLELCAYTWCEDCSGC